MFSAGQNWSCKDNNRKEEKKSPVSEGLLMNDCNLLHIPVETNCTAQRCRAAALGPVNALCSLALRPAIASPSPSHACLPFLLVYLLCWRSQLPQIDLWDWFGPPPDPLPLLLPMPSLCLFLRRLLINPPPSSVSCRGKEVSGSEKDRKEEKSKKGGWG